MIIANLLILLGIIIFAILFVYFVVHVLVEGKSAIPIVVIIIIYIIIITIVDFYLV
jgi:hypothetical protein